jgi:GTP-binding protein
VSINPGRVVFVKSATRASQFPEETLPQLAIAGRSNVGKSSLINSLFQRKKLAHVSGTPGATRLINFFLVDDTFYLVDLPGYGYAKRSRGERDEWREMVRDYIDSPRRPEAMLVLLDLRRGPEDEERGLLESLRAARIAAVVVATKADKLAKSRQRLALQELRAELAEYGAPLVGFSSRTGQGRSELWRTIESLFAPTDASEPS